MEDKVNIMVIGLGGFGLSAVEGIAGQVVGPDYLILSNKNDLLNNSPMQEKMLLGGGVTTNHSPELGKRRVLDSKDLIANALEGYDALVIITALGYGTGSGGAPVLASIAKDLGIFTIALVTTPFAFEGQNRDAIAKNALFNLKAICDSVMVISNQRLVKGNQKPQDGLDEKLNEVKKLTRYIISSLSNTIHTKDERGRNGFECFQSLYKTGKDTFFGCGAVLGEKQAVRAVRHAATNNLMTASLGHASRVLMTIDYNDEVSKETMDLLYDEIYNITGPDAEIICTKTVNPESMGIFFISLFATGEDLKEEKVTSDFDKLKDAINPNNFI